ncbi:MAG: hypothetical protein KC445_17725 [Anaerolineales bacterium]|nr:hypothetical protein [Anaerolineales bacterium]
MSTKNVAVYTAVIWVATFFSFGLVIVGAAVALEDASTATAETAAFLLALLLLLDTGVGIFLVFRKTQGLANSRRAVWTAVFAVMQLGTWAVAALTLLLVLNR